ncbi:hypothetical protein ACFY7Y_14680 [Streptomyces virginiae]
MTVPPDVWPRDHSIPAVDLPLPLSEQNPPDLPPPPPPVDPPDRGAEAT